MLRRLLLQAAPNAIQSLPARIPSIKDIETLISEARSQGWGRFRGRQWNGTDRWIEEVLLLRKRWSTMQRNRKWRVSGLYRPSVD